MSRDDGTVPPGADTAEHMLAWSRKLGRGAAVLRSGPPARAPAGPHVTVMQREGLRLLRYQDDAAGTPRPPLLIVYAMVNRPYVLDLTPERSFIAGLVTGGRTVYLLDWGDPQPSPDRRTLATVLLGELDVVIEHILDAHGASRLDLMGVCQGGTLSLCRAALRPAQVRRLVLTVTPVDFEAPEFLLARWLTHVDVEAMVERLGNVPGGLLNWAFLALKPFSLSSMKAQEFIELMDRPEALASFHAMEHWIRDSPDQPAAVFLDFVQSFFRDNALVRGGLAVDGEAVDLTGIACPVLNLHARADHIVPPAATTALAALLPDADYASREFDGGHIGLFAGRSRHAVTTTINDWLDAPDARTAPRKAP